MDKRSFIAKNVAALFKDGDAVNLGIGIPTLASTYVPKGINVMIHAENGALGVGKVGGYPWDNSTREGVTNWMETCEGEKGSWRTVHKDLCNAGNEVVTLIPGASCFDSCMSFAIARGGHLDATVLGALQVDEECNLANWKVPEKKLNGMGGAMDIVSGAKRVIVAMEHCTKSGAPKILKKCTLPLTAKCCVTDIVTDLCMISCTPGRLIVTAMAPGITREELISKTEARLSFSEKIGMMIE